MRNGQNKRMRGRNHGGHGGHGHGHNHGHGGHRKNQNPMSRVYESNGPDVKIRGNPAHIAEKYVQLARDAQASGDPISAENYYQHAEHYYRLIAAAQEQFRQNNPHLARVENDSPSGARDDTFDEEDGDQQQVVGEAPFGMREPQPYLPRDAQPFPQQGHQPQQQVHVQRPSQQAAQDSGNDIDRLPSFITGGTQQAPAPQQTQPAGYQGFNQNGHDNQADRFPLHRRRRRHRGSRNDFQGGSRGDDREESQPGE